MTTKLLAGMDLSGACSENGEYLAGIVGLKENIISTHRRLGHDGIHMRSMYNKSREKIFARLNFNLKYCVPFCLKIDRCIIVDEIMKSRSIRRARVKREVIERLFDQNVFVFLRGEISVFLQRQKKNMADFDFECDADSRDFVRGKGGGYAEPGIAHELADIIAWFYAHNKPLKRVNYNDRSADLRKAMEKPVRKIR
ncbi:hypothetical protein CENSYa_0809 [Cenarchaeum symbiosum A]|uniref:Uncharacterized protein n=1 Tax=Cenarchaeum symbiosum (strain A) TaxID=414004 RepID=A0RVS5_CENSY|nr:hypothetical protein CENSYa_0809 [Cenarchaeum symbiosum A]